MFNGYFMIQGYGEIVHIYFEDPTSPRELESKIKINKVTSQKSQVPTSQFVQASN